MQKSIREGRQSKPSLLRSRRLAGLLLAILGVLFTFPYLQGSLLNDLLLNILQAGIVLSAVAVMSADQRHTWLAAALGTLSLASGWVPRAAEQSAIVVVGALGAVAFYGFAIVVIMTHLLRESEVTFDLLSGALFGYLLLGFLWAELYGLIEFYHPHSVIWTSSPAAGLDWSDLLYFSFMTLTEAGYGDASPVTAPSRSIAILESVSGVFYVAVMISRLVGMHVAGRGKLRESASSEDLAADNAAQG